MRVAVLASYKSFSSLKVTVQTDSRSFPWKARGHQAYRAIARGMQCLELGHWTQVYPCT